MATKKDKQPTEATKDPGNIGASSAAVYDKTAEEIAAAQTTETVSADAEPQEATTSDAPIEQEGRKILADYPEAEAVYMTADGFGFFGEHDAHLHAARLADKGVVTVKRK